MMKNDTPLVWSSEHGRICPDCSRPVAACACKKGGSSLPGDGIVRVRKETKGRGGKTVTVVTGLPERELNGIAGDLKRRCGSGGTVKDGSVEIQGDHCAAVMGELERRGYRVKKGGG